MGSSIGIPRGAVARSFSAAATTYDDHAGLQRAVVDELLPVVSHDLNCHSILNVGSGTGYCSDRLQNRFPTATLINTDIAEGMLRFHAERVSPESCLQVCADAARLPFGPGNFDLVFSSLALQWSTDLQLVFSELSKVCTPGAEICVSTLVEPTLLEVKNLWAQIDDYQHVNRFATTADLIEVAEGAGLGLVEHRSRTFYRHHPDLQSLAAEMKGLGAHNLNPGQGRGLTGKNKYRRLQQAFDTSSVNGSFQTTFEVCLLKLQTAHKR